MMIDKNDSEAIFKVGYSEVCFFDSSRNSWSGSTARPLRTTVWYPADSATDEVLITAGEPEPLFIIGNAAENAALATDFERYPVVLISHGTGGTAQGMGWLGIRLARRGYIAVAVSHHGNTALEPYLAAGFACWWERARDLSVALDQLSDETLFTNRLDLSRVFAAGFSLGGYTVLALAGAITDSESFLQWNKKYGGGGGPREFPDLDQQLDTLAVSSPEFRQSMLRHGDSYLDPRIRAVFAFAPAPPVRGFTLSSLAQIELPVGMMVGRSDREAPHEPCACWLHQHLSNSQLILLDEGVGHYVFLCEATERGKALEPVICSDPVGVDRRLIHEQAAAAALRLFYSGTSGE